MVAKKKNNKKTNKKETSISSSATLIFIIFVILWLLVKGCSGEDNRDPRIVQACTEQQQMSECECYCHLSGLKNFYGDGVLEGWIDLVHQGRGDIASNVVAYKIATTSPEGQHILSQEINQCLKACQ